MSDVAADIHSIAESLLTLVRISNRFRAQAMAQDAELAAHVLLRVLATEGPMRASALAEHVVADPSTVSRQVAGLVKEGLLERRADPVDGRASLLVPTEKAQALTARKLAVRDEKFAELLADWDDADLAVLARLLDRLTGTYLDAAARLSVEHSRLQHTTQYERTGTTR